ncbi:hypothetical protein SAMN04487913_11867 [Arthrobacter sp. ok362]|nr:hypothetical protein SAMN04487913_11867 [Arthrobacter sp. ok362]
MYPAVCRARPGPLCHVASRFKDALWREMFYLVQSGVTIVKDIDTPFPMAPACPERWQRLSTHVLGRALHMLSRAIGLSRLRRRALALASFIGLTMLQC